MRLFSCKGEKELNTQVLCCIRPLNFSTWCYHFQWLCVRFANTRKNNEDFSRELDFEGDFQELEILPKL